MPRSALFASVRTGPALVLCVLALLATAGIARAQEKAAVSSYASVLAAHVTGEGVQYRALVEQRALLARHAAELAAVRAEEFDGWSRAQQIAYLINAYNLHVLATVVEHYPLERRLSPIALLRPANSVWQVAGFFNGLKHRVAGRDLTLDDIEHHWLRERLREPRIHFALVCAARSCPPLRAEPYTAEALDAQLDDQARRFLHDSRSNAFDRARGVVRLSEIFKWFGEDFRGFAPPRGYRGNGTERGVLAFASRYLPPATAEWLRDGRYRIEYINYDWSLNDVAVP